MLHTQAGTTVFHHLTCPQIPIVNTVDCRVKEPEKDSGLMGELTGGVQVGGGVQGGGLVEEPEKSGQIQARPVSALIQFQIRSPAGLIAF